MSNITILYEVGENETGNGLTKTEAMWCKNGTWITNPKVVRGGRALQEQKALLEAAADKCPPYRTDIYPPDIKLSKMSPSAALLSFLNLLHNLIIRFLIQAVEK